MRKLLLKLVHQRETKRATNERMNTQEDPDETPYTMTRSLNLPARTPSTILLQHHLVAP